MTVDEDSDLSIKFLPDFIKSQGNCANSQACESTFLPAGTIAGRAAQGKCQEKAKKQWRWVGARWYRIAAIVRLAISNPGSDASLLENRGYCLAAFLVDLVFGAIGESRIETIGAWPQRATIIGPCAQQKPRCDLSTAAGLL